MNRCLSKASANIDTIFESHKYSESKFQISTYFLTKTACIGHPFLRILQNITLIRQNYHILRMFEKLNGIVLHVLRYSDKNSIAHILTNRYGRMSFLLPQGATKNARIRNAMFMPLNIIEFEAKIIPGKDLHSFRDARNIATLTEIYSDPVKNAIAMFISELLTRSIQESEENPSLFRFIRTSIELLNEIEVGVANFHIWFLYNLGVFLGIQPDIETYNEGYWFDMANGVFTNERPLHNHHLTPQDAPIILLLSRMTSRNLHHFRFNRSQRGEILDIALNYYRLHNSMNGTLRSPEILKQLFI